MKRWTLGFVFTLDFSHVLLIHKEHPKDQKGFWNGLGGKFETDESIIECVSREIEEESDLRIADWREVGKVYGKDWEMSICTSTYSGAMSDARTMTDEQVHWFPVHDYPSNIKHNLLWMIPICIDALKRDEIDTIVIRYTNSDRWR